MAVVRVHHGEPSPLITQHLPSLTPPLPLSCVCMLIANKVEEAEPQDVDDFVYISDNTYTRLEFMRAEAAVLEALRYDLATITPYMLMQVRGEGEEGGEGGGREEGDGRWGGMSSRGVRVP